MVYGFSNNGRTYSPLEPSKNQIFVKISLFGSMGFDFWLSSLSLSKKVHKSATQNHPGQVFGFEVTANRFVTARMRNG